MRPENDPIKRRLTPNEATENRPSEEGHGGGDGRVERRRGVPPGRPPVSRRERRRALQPV